MMKSVLAFLLTMMFLAHTTVARRSASMPTPSSGGIDKKHEKDVAGLGLYGRGYPHAWGIDKSTTDVHNVVKKKNVQRRRRNNNNDNEES